MGESFEVEFGPGEIRATAPHPASRHRFTASQQHAMLDNAVRDGRIAPWQRGDYETRIRAGGPVGAEAVTDLTLQPTANETYDRMYPGVQAAVGEGPPHHGLVEGHHAAMTVQHEHEHPSYAGDGSTHTHVHTHTADASHEPGGTNHMHKLAASADDEAVYHRAYPTAADAAEAAEERVQQQERDRLKLRSFDNTMRASAAGLDQADEADYRRLFGLPEPGR